jgi:NADPH:quinone reductase
LMLKGMTAEYLLHRTCRVRAGDVVLVHAAAGGVGLYLCQWAKALGATVIGTVSSEEKARLARANGCEHPIITRHYQFAQDVLARTAGRGAAFIYDGLGREAFEENLAAIAYCGHWVSFGQASGAQATMPLDRLSEKSITLTRPVLFHYTMQRSALNEIARNTFEAYRSGKIRLDLRHRYPLANAAQAHRDLEARATTGPIVLLT